MLGLCATLVASAGLAVVTGNLKFPTDARAAYSARAVASGETTPETVSGTTLPGKETTLALSDGTQIKLPAGNKTMQIKLARVSNTITAPQPDLQTSGSMRTLEFDTNQIGNDFVPILTIPKKELGDLDANTVNVARVSDIQVDGATIQNAVVYLPVTRDNQGNVVVIDTATAAFAKTTAYRNGNTGRALARPFAQGNGIATVKYVPMTFQGHLEWGIEPQLVRMIPDSSAPGARRPADPVRDQEQLLKPVTNVIVLVHGHNEEEKDGSKAPSASEPWKVTYKQQVWNEFYKSFLDKKQAQLDCTAFYEFIYPTFRSIYSPVAGNAHAELLGDSFFAKLKYGAVNDNYQLEKMREAKTPANVMIVAHSMGGLVARAGVRQFDGWLKDNFQQLVTWGTPHHGSPLPTLNYALRGPYKTAYYGVAGGGLAEPLANIFLGASATKWMLNRFGALDTPGTRDLRWDNIQPLRLDEILKINTDAIPPGANAAEYDLTNGTWLYNDNLRRFNDSDPYKNSDKYTFIYGITSKSFEKSWAETAIGSTVIINMLKNPDKEMTGGFIGNSDGAVPLASMSGLGIANGRTYNLGDYDHEEYFAPTASALAPNGERTATWTFDALGLTAARCQCAPAVRVELSVDPSGSIVTVTDGQAKTFTATGRGIPPSVKKIEWVWDGFSSTPKSFTKNSGVGETESQAANFTFSIDPNQKYFTGYVYLYDITGSQRVELGRYGEILVEVVAAQEAPMSASPQAMPTEQEAASNAQATPAKTAPQGGKFFEVWSTGPVESGGATIPTTFTITQAWHVTQIVTYHYNGGKGATPGTIGLKAADGTIYGPWIAVGMSGAAGPDSAWSVTPEVVIPPGNYTVLDSDPGSWSQNAETHSAGMAYGIGVAVSNPSTSPDTVTPSAPSSVPDGIYSFRWKYPAECSRVDIVDVPVEIRGKNISIDFDAYDPAHEKHFVMKGNGSVDSNGILAFKFQTEYTYTSGRVGPPERITKIDGSYVGPFTGSGKTDGTVSATWYNGSCTGKISGGYFRDWADVYSR